jgi:DNA-directed RNA polymerase specialized sigma24 family protein
MAGQLYLRGVTVSELARASGVTYRAMKRRVDRALTS